MSARVAIVRPRDGSSAWEMQEPLGAEALCGFLREWGVSCRVFDRQLDALLGRDTLQELLDYQPTLVGFSLMTLEEAGDGARLATLLPKETRLCAGGILVTTNPEAVAALFPSRTRLMWGMGERQILYLATGTPIREPSPDKWAFASRDELADYLRLGGVINLRSAVGCPGKCTFCATPGIESSWQGRDVSLIALEMAHLGKQYEPIFNFTDDSFGPPERILSLIEELKKHACRAAFSLELRAGDLIRCSSHMLEQIYRGGLCRIFVGLESTEPTVQKGWRKEIDVPAFFSALHRAQEAGIEVAVGTILFHRDTTPASFFREASLLYEHGLLSPKAALSRLILYPGTFRADPSLRTPRAERLSPETSKLYNALSRSLAPLLESWRKNALALPGALCRDFLYGSETAVPLRLAQKELDRQCRDIIEKMEACTCPPALP